MMRPTVSSVVLIILHSVISANANVKITPIAVENKANLKSDLKVEEARYQDPVMPEYYGNSYDRNRQNFVTSNYGSYGSGLSNFDRNGYGSGADRYGSNYDRYGSQYNRDRTGINSGVNPLRPGGTNYMAGGVYNPGSSLSNSYGSGIGSSYGSGGSAYGNSLGGSYGNSLSGAYGNSLGGGYGNNIGGSYGNRNPYEASMGGGSVNGPYGAPGMGLFSPDLEGKSSFILPLAGAALLGIAAYALVASPGMAMGPMIGKRRKRSLFDEKLEQHLAYRAHHKQAKRV